MSDFLSKKITRISFVMALLVVLIHSYNHFMYKNFSYFTQITQVFLSDKLPKFAVPTFFAISGFLFFYSTTSFNQVLKKMKKRIFSVLIPFLVWNVLYTLIILALNYVPYVAKNITSADTFNLSNILQGVFLNKYSPHLWYVRTLCILIVLTPLFLLLKKNPIIKYVVLALLLIYCIVLPFNVIILPVWVEKYLKLSYWFYFYLGAVLCDFTCITNSKKQKPWISFVCLIALIVLALLLTFSNFYLLMWSNVIVIFMVGFAWFASDLLVTEKTFAIEKTSFFIYCFHYLPQLLLKKLFYILLPKNNLAIAFNYIFSNTIITLIIVYLAIIILNKISPKIYAFLSGGRTLPKNSNK